MEVPAGELPAEDVLRRVKSCMMCHQLGTPATREIPAALGEFASTLDAWDHRVRVGPSGGGMSTQFAALGPQRAMFADWTDRIATGELPEAPPRPAGLERNLVITQWDWGAPTTFTHTHAVSDKHDPTVNANGRVYGPDRSTDTLIWLDPVNATRDARITFGCYEVGVAPDGGLWCRKRHADRSHRAPPRSAVNVQGRGVRGAGRRP